MCGIAGLYAQQKIGPAEQWVRSMLSRLVHRGPDDEGVWADPAQGIVLGHRRLAIIDLSPAGHQPMLSDDGQVAITFNGEIYNFLELRVELEAHGATFQSRSDTEVLIKGYQHWGLGVLDHLVGMFAFALWDTGKRRLFLARDRVGEKPLYYAHTPHGVAFASEVGALSSVPWVDRGLDQEALALYLQYQYIPAPYSIYRGARKLPPAHAMLVENGEVKIWRYWDPVPLAMGPRLKLAEDEMLERLEGLLRQAIRGQMISDVPLGAFLSGGIDSSTVVSLMVELASAPVKTFTIGFESPAYNEARHAEAVAKYLGTEHTVEYLTEHDALGLIPRIPLMYGEPFADSSALPTHLVSRVARKSVTVSLSGDGGDEAFGGYGRYAWLERFYQLSYLLRPFAGVLRPVARFGPRRMARVVPLLRLPISQVYRGRVSIFSTSEVAALTGRSPELSEYERAWNFQPGRPPRRHAMLADLLTYLPEAILVKVDRAAMAISLETRAPLLDHRVLEFSLQLPLSYVRDKYLLKRLAYRRIPRELLDRPKQGFSVPLGRWFKGELRGLLTDALTAQRLEHLGIQNVGLVRQIMDEHLSGVHDHTSRLWALLVLSLWEQSQYD